MHKEDAQEGCTKMHKEDAQGGCTRKMHKEDAQGTSVGAGRAGLGLNWNAPPDRPQPEVVRAVMLDGGPYLLHGLWCTCLLSA